MPKLSKIRLTGCSYEGLRKMHKNSIFDLTKNEEGAHTIFTLANGCGKGVMMQLISQIILPETRWGKNNGNKLTSMFLDPRGNINPSTFHIVLEWILDTVPKKRLITGIAIKADRKNIGMEEEENTGLSYFLYTHEHDNLGPFTVENLPLFDKKTDEAIDINIFEKFLNDNKRDFIKYSKSSAKRTDSDYYRYLESRGIYRSEWSNLKAMNKSEGGIGAYFVGASDNKSIFDKIIIPAINENIKRDNLEDGHSLIEMFKSNLSITKDLPILIKREGYYKDLLFGIKPLIENARAGSGFLSIRNRLIDRGNDIYFILKEEENLVIKDIEKWDSELVKAKREKKELEYKKDNLIYNQERKEIKEMEDKFNEISLLYGEEINSIKVKKKEQILYRINERLYKIKEIESEIRNKDIEIKTIKETMNISDVKGRIEKLDKSIELEWKKTKEKWIEDEGIYLGYLNYTNDLIKENKSKIKRYIEKKDFLRNETNKFQLMEQSLSRKKEKLLEYYDFMSIEFPERILEDLQKEESILEAKKTNLNKEKEDYHEKSTKLTIEINKLKYKLEEKNRDNKDLENSIKEQEEYEINISRKICKQLLENYDGSLLTHEWFSKKLEELILMEEGKESIFEDIKKDTWEKNLEKSLNNEDYFIPNKDIISVKKEIEKIGIHVESGLEYLSSIKDAERDEILGKYPEFLYSVVIAKNSEWELIEKNLVKDLFLSNMVPIYIRELMRYKDRENFKILKGEVYELTDKNKYKLWKKSLEEVLDNLLTSSKKIGDDLRNIRIIKDEINNLMRNDTAFKLNQRLKEREGEILEILDKIRYQEEELFSVNNKFKKREIELSQINKHLADLEGLTNQVVDYIEEKSYVDKEKIAMKKVEEDIKDIKENISFIEKDNEEIEIAEKKIKDSYHKWIIQIQSIFKDLKGVHKQATYNPTIDRTISNYNVPDFKLEVDYLNILLSERKVIEDDINSRNIKLAILDNEIKNLNNNLDREIKNINNLDKKWFDYQDLNITYDEIIIKLDIIERDLKESYARKDEIKSKIDKLDGNIESRRNRLLYKEKELLKRHNRPAVTLEVENIIKHINKVESHILSNERFINICIENLDKYKERNARLEINLSKIRNGYDLDWSKGKVDSNLKEKIEDNPDLLVDEWFERMARNGKIINEAEEEGDRYRSKFLKNVEIKIDEERLRKRILSVIKEAKTVNFSNNLASYKSMESHFQHELLRLSKDKEKAEEAMKQWTNRAAIYVVRMVEALKSMVSSMNYINEQGYAFPLVKLKRAENLPKSESEIIYLLNEYFIQTIQEVINKNEDIENIDDKRLKELMGDKVIFSKAIQGRYPILMVYKMSEQNEFKYARARDEYYTTWEAINKGEGDLPEGSGGQTLSVNTFVAMMIMSFRKKYLGNESPSTVLFMDNPFGRASAKHVLDPIFEIADKLNFQLICFAAPEIIKIEISERFPVFWELKIKEGKIIYGGRIRKE